MTSFSAIPLSEAQHLYSTRYLAQPLPDAESWYLAQSSHYALLTSALDMLIREQGVTTCYEWGFWDGETHMLLIGIPLPVEIQLELPL